MPKHGCGASNGAVRSRLRAVTGAPEIILAAILASFISSAATEARAQNPEEAGIALKGGESVDLGSLWYVANCRSIMIGSPEVEVLEGRPELKLSVKEEMVLPRSQNCSSKVPGAILTATAKDVKEAIHAKLTYRVKYKTKDGDRQRARTYNVSLFP
jgi:hypothetical protein